MFGFLCNPLFVTKQVKIHVHNIKYAPEEAELESGILNQQVSLNSRIKPQSLSSSSLADKNLEAALQEFVRGLQLKEESYEEYELQLLLSEFAFLSYTLLSSPPPSSRNSNSSAVMRLLSQPFSPVSPMSQTVVVEGLTGFFLLLQRWESTDRTDRTDAVMPSLEKLLFCTDILLSSLQWTSFNREWSGILSSITRQVTGLISSYLYEEDNDSKQGSCLLAFGQILIKVAQLFLISGGEHRGLQSALSMGALTLRQLAGDESLSIYLLLSLLTQSGSGSSCLQLCLPGVCELSQEILVTLPTRTIVQGDQRGNDHALCLLLSSLRSSPPPPLLEDSRGRGISFHGRFLWKCLQYRLRITSPLLSPSQYQCPSDRLHM